MLIAINQEIPYPKQALYANITIDCNISTPTTKNTEHNHSRLLVGKFSFSPIFFHSMQYILSSKLKIFLCVIKNTIGKKENIRVKKRVLFKSLTCNLSVYPMIIFKDFFKQTFPSYVCSFHSYVCILYCSSCCRTRLLSLSLV